MQHFLFNNQTFARKYVDGNYCEYKELFYYIIQLLVNLKRPEFGTFKGDLY